MYTPYMKHLEFFRWLLVVVVLLFHCDSQPSESPFHLQGIWIYRAFPHKFPHWKIWSLENGLNSCHPNGGSWLCVTVGRWAQLVTTKRIGLGPITSHENGAQNHFRPLALQKVLHMPRKVTLARHQVLHCHKK